MTTGSRVRAQDAAKTITWRVACFSWSEWLTSRHHLSIGLIFLHKYWFLLCFFSTQCAHATTSSVIFSHIVQRLRPFVYLCFCLCLRIRTRKANRDRTTKLRIEANFAMLRDSIFLRSKEHRSNSQKYQNQFGAQWLHYSRDNPTKL